ncbi:MULTISPECIES: hypothetical protein [unclassified Rhizobium]|uniref:hypothetical protein n=1 Tax=unclassified Rhizobium TaxID=2613769 RepID=UPI001ADBB954|nr:MULTISPECIES: hypothetical protein [unclassified Rhizobium]MBO9124651.1 hypothetical protein [Rhizobium sp. 16-488-2b]MBO9175235.1 hypothetical protein [Rhizobium sp. 16-488-2a]
MAFLKLAARFIEALFPPVLLIALAYFSAVLTSAATYAILLEMLRPTINPRENFSSGVFLFFAVFAVLFALPGVCAALVAWEKGYRSVFYYAATWGIAGLVISAFPLMFVDFSHDAFSRLRWLVWTVSGASGGIVYWIGAGRYTRVIDAKRDKRNKLADDHYSKR